MVPPSNSPVVLDPRAISGIAGSISIACWVVVFTPQILANFRRQSCDGLSVGFVVVWLIGDVFNVVGSILQGVLSTMIILAIYYTVADLVLLVQCLYYMRRQARRLLQFGPESSPPRRPSNVEENPRDTDTLIAAHLNPTTPFVSPSEEELAPSTALRSILINLVALLAVCVAGVLGWWISPPTDEGNAPSTEMNTLGQVFGYLCAVLYLASRVPQIILNAKRKSCDGVSLLFFLFACLGNTTFLASIFSYIPGENEGTYADYLKVNSSWIIGSAGTLALDLVIFSQFFLYRGLELVEEISGSESDYESDIEAPYRDERTWADVVRSSTSLDNGNGTYGTNERSRTT